MIITYGPSQDETTNKKDEFWEKLTEVVENLNGRVIILGDFNGRVGRRNNVTADVIGQYGEEHRNKNGERLINYCVENNLIVTNTFYPHKNIHKYTREVKSRNEKSIIDYILINRPFRKGIVDVKVRRGSEIYSDHYLIVAKVRLRTQKKENLKTMRQKETKDNEIIKAYKLQESETAKKFREGT